MSGELLGGLAGIFLVLVLSSLYLGQKPATRTLLRGALCKLLTGVGGPKPAGGSTKPTKKAHEVPCLPGTPLGLFSALLGGRWPLEESRCLCLASCCLDLRRVPRVSQLQADVGQLEAAAWVGSRSMLSFVRT